MKPSQSGFCCAEIIPGLLDSIRKAASERREYGKPPKSRG